MLSRRPDPNDVLLLYIERAGHGFDMDADSPLDFKGIGVARQIEVLFFFHCINYKTSKSVKI